MRYLRVLFVLIVLAIQTSAQGLALETGMDPTSIGFDRTLHFLDANGEDVTVEPGMYRVESISPTQLGLLPGEGNATIVVQAMPSSHQEPVVTATALLVPPDAGDEAFHLILLLPGGRGLDSVASTTGIRTRGIFGPGVADAIKIAAAAAQAGNIARVQQPAGQPEVRDHRGMSSNPSSTTAPPPPPSPPSTSTDVRDHRSPPLLAFSSPNCPAANQRIKTVTTALELRDTLLSDFTGTIFIPSGTTIDLFYTDNINNPLGNPVPVRKAMRYLPVKSCVQLKGTRNGLDPGALLFTNLTTQGHVFQISGHDVRIEGLRFQGPVPTYTDDQREAKWEVNAIGVQEEMGKDLGVNVVIDNNDFWFWTAAIAVGWEDGPHNPPLMNKDQAKLISVTRNYFHRNAREGAGYGVVVGSGYVLIEGNLFTHNRHAVAHGGYANSGYIARYNYVLEGGFTQGSIGYWNQHFDVHGQGSGGYGGDAGGYFDIAYNTIRGEQTYFAGTQTRPAFMLRGKPTIKASFHDNIVMHNNSSAAVRLKTNVNCESDIGCTSACPSYAQCNLEVGPNLYNTDTTGELAVGDFDGDGRDDVFLANGTGWWYSSAGLTEWRFLRASNLRIKDLRFGRFNGDARTDVLFDAGGWYVWSPGDVAPKWVRGDGTRLTDCVFGDFNGDGITDALRTNGTTWSVALGAQGPWIPKFNSSVTAPNLRVGDFNGDRRVDVLFITGETALGPIKTKVWSYWQYDSTALTRINTVLGNDITALVVADFDGDGRADVAQTDGNGWRWWRNGSNAWEVLRGSGGQNHYKDIRLALLGRFTPGDFRLDAISYELLPRADESGRFDFGRRFVIWRKGRDTFTPWTPDLQEMR